MILDIDYYMCTMTITIRKYFIYLISKRKNRILYTHILKNVYYKNNALQAIFIN